MNKQSKSSLEVIDIMMNENVLKLLKSSMWDLATCADGEYSVASEPLNPLQRAIYSER